MLHRVRPGRKERHQEKWRHRASTPSPHRTQACPPSSQAHQYVHQPGSSARSCCPEFCIWVLLCRHHWLNSASSPFPLSGGQVVKSFSPLIMCFFWWPALILTLFSHAPPPTHTHTHTHTHTPRTCSLALTKILLSFRKFQRFWKLYTSTPLQAWIHPLLHLRPLPGLWSWDLL